MDSDYLNFLINYPGTTALQLLALFLLAMMRIAPVIALAPFLGGKVIPISARAGFAIILSFVFLPTILITSTSHNLDFNFAFSILCIKELFIGFILGFLVSIPFTVAQSCGILIDYLRGSSAMTAQDPTMQNQSSSIGNLFNFILIAMFFQIDGAAKFFDIYMKGYQILPADVYPSTQFFNLKLPFWEGSVNILNHIATLSVQLSAPALIAILMTEFFLGIANRLAPQVQIAFLGMSLKSLIGLLILWAGWFFILKQTGIQTTNWLKWIDSMLDSWQFLKLSN